MVITLQLLITNSYQLIIDINKKKNSFIFIINKQAIVIKKNILLNIIYKIEN